MLHIGSFCECVCTSYEVRVKNKATVCHKIPEAYLEKKSSNLLSRLFFITSIPGEEDPSKRNSFSSHGGEKRPVCRDNNSWIIDEVRKNNKTKANWQKTILRRGKMASWPTCQTTTIILNKYNCFSPIWPRCSQCMHFLSLFMRSALNKTKGSNCLDN